jgi:hypothetical protein
VGQCLANVVEERRPLAVGDIQAELTSHQGGDMSALDQMLQHVLSVRAAVSQGAQDRYQSRMKIGDANLG